MPELLEIENRVKSLSAVDLIAFRKWFDEFDSHIWDLQLEKDIKVG